MSAPVVFQPRLLQVRAMYSPDPDTGDHYENVLWFQSASTGTPTVAQLTTMASHFDPGWYSVWSTVGCSTSGGGGAYFGSIWTDYSSAFGASYDSRGTYTPVAGSQGNPVPNQVAALISLHIAERWRGGHARIYLPWVGVSAQSTTDPSDMKGTVQTALTSGFAALNAITTGSGVLGGQQQMVYRQRTDPTHAHLMPISSFTVQTMFATQRRRLRKAPHH